ncbi:hypothetical protein [Neoaquamicrobium sediminum]|uniref:hypothetical protein n=1 Tax=Neoaquamicrobium sediminum TaxID=1849104 RepID=UPI00403642F3
MPDAVPLDAFLEPDDAPETGNVLPGTKRKRSWVAPDDSIMATPPGLAIAHLAAKAAGLEAEITSLKQAKTDAVAAAAEAKLVCLAEQCLHTMHVH